MGTDGIWEGPDKAGEMFGKQRLQSLIRSHASSSAPILLKTVFVPEYNLLEVQRNIIDTRFKTRSLTKFIYLRYIH